MYTVLKQVDFAVSVTLMAGLFQLLMRVCRLGVIATYMSSAFVGGFMTASAIQIIVSQV
jgi:MFS superfamily sulfate permease-like transporter